MIPAVSFEFFPPKNRDAQVTLLETAAQLQRFRPDFISVTYGAGGSTRDATVSLVEELIRANTTPVAMHLTCIGSSRMDIDTLAASLWQKGVRRLVALRGDAPKSAVSYTPPPDGYAFAADLVEGLKKVAPFDISVAGYPEKHPEALSLTADMDALKRKVDAGAARILTQFFFQNDDFLRFRDATAAIGITVPIVPGMLPIYNFSQAKRFAAMCGATIPAALEERFADADDKPYQTALASYWLLKQCAALKQQGVNTFHFYTLNRPELTMAACVELGRYPT
jgi:methylenetetrahydrofolate reductase (NADPH)